MKLGLLSSSKFHVGSLLVGSVLVGALATSGGTPLHIVMGGQSNASNFSSSSFNSSGEIALLAGLPSGSTLINSGDGSAFLSKVAYDAAVTGGATHEVGDKWVNDEYWEDYNTWELSGTPTLTDNNDSTYDIEAVDSNGYIRFNVGTTISGEDTIQRVLVKKRSSEDQEIFGSHLVLRTAVNSISAYSGFNIELGTVVYVSPGLHKTTPTIIDNGDGYWLIETVVTATANDSTTYHYIYPSRRSDSGFISGTGDITIKAVLSDEQRLTDMIADTAATAHEITDFLWSQGESDASQLRDGDITEKRYYECLLYVYNRVIELFPTLNKVTILPLGRRVAGVNSGWENVRNAQRNLAINIAGVKYGTDTYAGTMSDNVHADESGYALRGAFVAADITTGNASPTVSGVVYTDGVLTLTTTGGTLSNGGTAYSSDVDATPSGTAFFVITDSDDVDESITTVTITGANEIQLTTTLGAGDYTLYCGKGSMTALDLTGVIDDGTLPLQTTAITFTV